VDCRRLIMPLREAAGESISGLACGRRSPADGCLGSLYVPYGRC